MGAEQVGYLVRGPGKITARQIRAAVRACRRQRRELLLDMAPGESTRDERMDAALSATGEYFDPEDIPENPEPQIREFVAWWSRPGTRDTARRQDPDDPGQVLLYAGDMSWGDEPEGGGYRMLKQAYTWGYVEALGIR